MDRCIVVLALASGLVPGCKSVDERIIEITDVLGPIPAAVSLSGTDCREGHAMARSEYEARRSQIDLLRPSVEDLGEGERAEVAAGVRHDLQAIRYEEYEAACPTEWAEIQAILQRAVERSGL